MRSSENEVAVVGVGTSNLSLDVLQCTLNSYFDKLIIVHAKPSPSSALGVDPAEVKIDRELWEMVDETLKKIAAGVIENAQELCFRNSVHDVTVEIIEGDVGEVLCKAANRHNASVLVVGANKSGGLGNVSGYCAHNASCSVKIVKPKLGSKLGSKLGPMLSSIASFYE